MKVIATHCYVHVSTVADVIEILMRCHSLNKMHDINRLSSHIYFNRMTLTIYDTISDGNYICTPLALLLHYYTTNSCCQHVFSKIPRHKRHQTSMPRIVNTSELLSNIRSTNKKTYSRQSFRMLFTSIA